MATPIAVATLIASIFLVAAFALSLYRAFSGPSLFDRIVALDLIGGICLCIIVMFAIYFDQQVLMDAAFVIAIVSFIGTVAFARYLSKGEEK